MKDFSKKLKPLYDLLAVNDEDDVFGKGKNQMKKSCKEEGRSKVRFQYIGVLDRSSPESCGGYD